jgi:D-glycero-beta-D-manno-heptose-7-phosphate kinase
LSSEDQAVIIRAVGTFPQRCILVVGDVMMDQFVWGEVSRISPEAPVPVVRVINETSLLGGAANVVNNLLGLKSRVCLAGVVGNDGTGRRLLKKLQTAGVNTDGLIVDDSRPTAVKTRVIAHQQQVVRVDKEKSDPLSTEVLDRLIGGIERNAAGLGGIIVSDYDKGVVSLRLMAALKKIAKQRGIPLAVDPKPQHLDWYRGVTLITPNHLEAGIAVGRKIESESDLHWAGRQLLKRLRCDSVLITRGREGMALFSQNRKVALIPTEARKVFDVTGAGDTVIATLMLALASGLDLIQSCRTANYAAGLVVGELGTAAIQAPALKKVLLEAGTRK